VTKKGKKGKIAGSSSIVRRKEINRAKRNMAVDCFMKFDARKRYRSQPNPGAQGKK